MFLYEFLHYRDFQIFLNQCDFPPLYVYIHYAVEPFTLAKISVLSSRLARYVAFTLGHPGTDSSRVQFCSGTGYRAKIGPLSIARHLRSFSMFDILYLETRDL